MCECGRRGRSHGWSPYLGSTAGSSVCLLEWLLRGQPVAHALVPPCLLPFLPGAQSHGVPLAAFPPAALCAGLVELQRPRDMYQSYQSHHCSAATLCCQFRPLHAPPALLKWILLPSQCLGQGCLPGSHCSHSQCWRGWRARTLFRAHSPATVWQCVPCVVASAGDDTSCPCGGDTGTV